jgi:diguanylate cyclase (GGDEF)-like protein/PAS domain S-box-containing protein
MRSTLPIEVPPYFWTMRDKVVTGKKALFYRNRDPRLHMKNYLRPQTVALITLASGLAASVATWFFVGQQADREARAEFATRANLATNLVERRVQRYVDLLYGMEAFVSDRPDLSRREFYRYVYALQAARRFPGVQSLQLIRRVPAADREAFRQAVRQDRSLVSQGYPAFDIMPAGERDEYWVIDYVEPMTGNEPAFGLDLRTREATRIAMERARDTGLPVATGRYRLVQERGSSYGNVLYLPIFDAPPPRLLAERRERVRAWVNVVLRTDSIFEDTLASPFFAGLRLAIHDLGPAASETRVQPSEATAFYRSQPPGARAGTGPSILTMSPARDVELTVAGRIWLLQFDAAAPAASAWLRPLPMLSLGAGLSITLLLYAILRALARTRSEAVNSARQATRDLRGQMSFNQRLLEAIPYPVYFKDATGRYLGCNRTFETQLGITREKLVGLTPHDLMPREDADRLNADDQALLASGGIRTMETRVPRPSDGQPRDAIFSKATFFNADGQVAGIVGVIVDITDRKELEAKTKESHELLRAVIEASPVAIIARDVDLNITMWNAAAERLFGWSESEVLGQRPRFVPDRLQAEVAEQRVRAMRGETILLEETQRLHRDGHEVDVAMTIAPIRGPEGQVTGHMANITDLRPKKEAERALRESEERLRLAMEATQMGLWYWSLGDDAFTYSDGLGHLFGRPADAPHVDYRTLQVAIHPEDRALFHAAITHAIRAGNDLQIDFRVVWPDGSIHWLTNRGQVHRDASRRALRIVGVTLDITDRKLAEQRIAHMAHHDALTGLPNRALLHDRIRQAIAHAHRAGGQLAVMFIDLDRFKTINDSLGHPVGDRLLQGVASRILACLREGDTVSRLGGDEFVIVVPGLDEASDASHVAAKIQEALANAFHVQGHDLHVSASVGISLYPADGMDAETLMRNADTAMYHAKDSGRANYQFFTPHMNVAAQQRLNLESALRRAVENGEFELHYQPLFDLGSRTIAGAEALLRWQPPGRDRVPPGEFIVAAEETGLIVPIGEWVLREALRQVKPWSAGGRPLRVAVNVSANQLSRAGFAERLKRLFEETGVDPGRLELEITERVIVEGAGEARITLDQLAAIGVGIAIDDFGTGYSGLAYLKRFPIDTVKIDQSFVRDITVDPDDAAIVTAIVAMAQSLGIGVVAEGVETEEQAASLVRFGCRRAQGYLFARPMPARDFEALLANGGARVAAD